MAITLTTEQIREKFKYVQASWDSFEEYEEFFLQYLSETKGGTIYYTKNNEQIIISPVNHFPELKEYEIWREGYQATGEHQASSFVGKTVARNFAQACHTIMCEKFLESVEKYNDPSYTSYIDTARWDYDPQSLSFWGCRFYWSKELAEKSFG